VNKGRAEPSISAPFVTLVFVFFIY
jgi:hypothetical protein